MAPMTFAEKLAQAQAQKPTVEQWLEKRLSLVREQRVWLRRTFPEKGRAPGISAIKDRISMVTLCGDIAQARLLEEPTQQGWRPL
jgi:hypothetical protein